MLKSNNKLLQRTSMINFNHINSWQALKKFIDLQDTTKEKGDLFEQLVFYYFLLDPVYKTKIENIWLLKDVPYPIKSYLNLPERDEGIDLIAVTKDDEYWTIQCKYRQNEDSSITREDIATFLDISHNVCKNIKQKIVCSTANRQSYKFEKFYSDDITFILANTWNSLEENFFIQIQDILYNKTPCLEPYSPKPHQQRAMDNAYEHYITNENNRGKLIMACGSGKSLTSYWIANRIKAKKVLVAVPSLALIKQMLEVWTRESVANKTDINWIAVCSDDTVSKREDDIFSASTKDLGIDVSTDVDYIANWLQKPSHEMTIVFTTYQSGKIIAEASKKAYFIYDLGIMDEAHKTAGIKDSLFSHLLFDKNIDINKRLFMTATERRYKGESDEIISMDNLEIYGEDFEVLTFKEALESTPPILSDYKIITILVTQDEVASLIEKNTYITTEDNQTHELEAEMLASIIALHKAIKKYDIKHTISFHSSIERAKNFKAQEQTLRTKLGDYTHLDTFHVSGETPISTRNKTLKAFSQGDCSLVTNARCLTEGVDVPSIDCVLFADPKQSTVDIVQAVGRALRTAPNKEFGYVLVPVLVKKHTDLEDIQSTTFQAVITILRALASNDERIIDYFNLQNQSNRNNSRGIVEFDIPQSIQINLETFHEAVRLLIHPKLKKLKWRPFEEARDFVRRLELKSSKEWLFYCQNKIQDIEPKPIDIPNSPSIIYKIAGWNGMKDWLGTTNDKKYLSFEEAKEFVRDLGIKTLKEWQLYCIGKHPKYGIKPDYIPRKPEAIYRKNGWKNYKDWLMTNRGMKDFEDAKSFVIELGLSTVKEWEEYCKTDLKPRDIPRDPNARYRKQWINWDDWLTGKTSKLFGEWQSFEDAREFVRNLGLKGQVEWRQYCKGMLKGFSEKPFDIPSAPDVPYKDKGWVDYGDWLGTGRKRRTPNDALENTWLPYEEARNFVHTLKLKNFDEWKAYIKGDVNNLPQKPFTIPNSPLFVYKDSGWLNWNDWLGNDGTTKTRIKEALPFSEARSFVRSLRLKNVYEWNDYKKGKLIGYEPIPNNIPKSPYSYYKNDGWIGFHDWLGIDK